MKTGLAIHMHALLLLKLFLVPVIIAMITLAGRRWGAVVAGSFAGFPVVTGPILFFIAVEQSTSFASKAAGAAILAVLGNLAFGIVYSWVSKRKSWHISLLCGWVVYFICVAILNEISLSAWQAGVLTVAGLLAASQCYPRIQAGLAKLGDSGQRVSDIPYRMIASAALVVCVTLFSVQLGSNLTGLLAVFPVMGSVLAVFSHIHYGQAYAVNVLRGMVQGFYAFTAFCLMVAYGLQPGSISYGFAMALTLAIVAQTIMLRLQPMKLKNDVEILSNKL